MPEMRVELVYALPGQAWRVQVDLPETACVADALALGLPRLQAIQPTVEADPARLAVFGRPVALQDRLHPGDRIELLRPLLADPKQARRQRAQRRR